MSSCAKETCIHSSVCMYYADRCTTNGDCGDFKPPQPKRPHGEWIVDSPPQYADGAKCSNCGCEYFGAQSFNFCPDCGASMTNEGEVKW